MLGIELGLASYMVNVSTPILFLQSSLVIFLCLFLGLGPQLAALKGFLMALHSKITPDRHVGSYKVHISNLAQPCKGNTLPAVLLL